MKDATKLTKPQERELVRRHNLAVKLPRRVDLGRGGIVCHNLRKLGFLDTSNDPTISGTQKALELGGDVPENSKEWIDAQGTRYYEQAVKRREKVSDLLKTLGESDLEGEAYYAAIEEAAKKLKPDGVL